jgi:hypothetical protein
MRDEILTLLGLTHVPKARTQSPHYLQQLEELRSKANHTVPMFMKDIYRWTFHKHLTDSFFCLQKYYRILTYKPTPALGRAK